VAGTIITAAIISTYDKNCKLVTARFELASRP